MSLRDLARTSLTVKAALVLIAVVVVRVAVRLLRRWLGDDFLDAATASMIVTVLDGLVVGAIGFVAVGLRRAMQWHVSQSRTEHELVIHADTAETEAKLARLRVETDALAEAAKALPTSRPRPRTRTKKTEPKS